MSVKVSVHQLREQLPELLDRAVESGEECIIQRDGQDYAVLVSAREWQRRAHDLDHGQPPSARIAAQERRRREVGRALDALGPEYRLSPEKQARAEELLERKERLTPDERGELEELLRESDAVILRRAEALKRIG
jgi:prevent-host-death family protein